MKKIRIRNLEELIFAMMVLGIEAILEVVLSNHLNKPDNKNKKNKNKNKNIDSK